MAERHVLIIGGGIVGVSAACFLARRGVRTTLLERDTIADSASTGNAGLVSIGHGPLPRPGLTWRTIRWMLDGSSPLYIPPRVDADLARWLWGFRRACAPGHHRRSIEVLAALGHPAGACFRELVETEQLPCEYRAAGQMDVFLTDDGLRGGAAEAQEMTGLGYESEVLDGAALRAREPAFTDEVRGAVLYPERAFASPGAFVAALAERTREHGATIEEGCAVERLLVEGGRCVGARTADGRTIEADAVLLAAGIWTTRLARDVGVHVPMQPGKGYHLSLTNIPTLPTIACVCAERFVAVTPMEGGLRLAGTLEFSGINDRIVDRRVDMLRAGARRYLHGVDAAEEAGRWCGLRPCTADGLPVVGWAPGVGNLFLATGHAMMGFTLGPLCARLAVESMLDGRPSVSLAGMEPDRFAAVH